MTAHQTNLSNDPAHRELEARFDYLNQSPFYCGEIVRPEYDSTLYQAVAYDATADARRDLSSQNYGTERAYGYAKQYGYDGALAGYYVRMYELVGSPNPEYADGYGHYLRSRYAAARPGAAA